MLIDGLNLVENSINSNLVITNVTLAEQAALTNLNVGEVVYVLDSAQPGLQTWNGTTWVAVGGAGGAVAYSDITGKPTLAVVATSGSYADLSNKPTIPTVPTAVSAFTNDSGFQTASDVTTAITGKLDTTQKGAANGVAPLDGTGVIASQYLPSYVDDILMYANQASFPATGEAGKIYVSEAVNLTYRWTGSAYVEVSSAGGSPVASGVGFTATGSIAATNVQSAIAELDTEKAPLASPTFTGVASASTPVAGTNTTQLATTAFVTTSLASKADLSVVMNNQTAAYTTVAADNGKQINITTGGVTLGSSVHAAGAVFSVYNQSASAQNISFSGVTFYKAGTSTAATSPISLSARGVASILFVTASEAIISGNI